LARQLIYSEQVSPSLQAAITSILQPQQSKTIPVAPEVFVRIWRLDAILKDGQIIPGTQLAGPNGPPVAFLTIPEGIAGFTVDAVLSRLGYADDEIAKTFGGSKAVAIVFKYPNAVQSLGAVSGELGPDVLNRVVRATWQNLFRTFKDLAEKEGSHLKFQGDDREFVASFPLWGQLRLMGVSYSHLEAEGGGDWYYRRLLQNLLWVTPKFLGTGWAADANGSPGAPEYLGPNVSLSKLDTAKSLAILSL
jgi:hypothetical protein